MKKNEFEKLKDIKDLEIINLPLFDITLISIIIFISFISFIFLYKKFKIFNYFFNKEQYIKDISLEKLRSIKLSNTIKDDLYIFSIYGKYIFLEGKTLVNFNNLNKSVSHLKYSNEKKEIDDKIKKNILNLIQRAN